MGQDLLPGWLQALVRQLSDGGAEASPAPFAVIPLLQEVIAITESIAQGKEAPFTEDRQSLKIDLERAIAALGPAAAAEGKRAISEFRGNDIPKLLDQAAGARKLRGATQALLMDLSSPSGRVAAWRDCVDAFGGGADGSECESRLRHLSTLFEGAGYDWSERANAISRVISLSDWFLQPGVDPRNVSVDDRLAAAEAVVAEEIVPSGATVVWVAFADAAVSDPLVKKEPLEFYDSSIWDAVLAGSWPGNPSWQSPPELADPASARHLGGLPHQEFVMVRVALGDIPLADARSRARDLALAAVDLAGAERESEWVLLDGAAAYSGGWWGSLWFSDPRERRIHLPALMSPLADGIADIDDDLIQRVAAGDPDARDLVADVRWLQNITRLPDLEQRLPLLVALIERLLVPSAIQSDKWYGAAEHYFDYLLAFDELHDAIWDADYYGVNRARRPGVQVASPEIQGLAGALIKLSGKNRIDVDVAEGIRQAAALRACVDSGSMEDRMLAEIERRTADGNASAQWVEEARAGFSALLSRARRQRNAATHGTRTVPAVVASIEPFLMKLAGRLVGAQHRCVEQQLDLTTELEAWRLLRLRRCDDLRNGGRPDALLVF